MKTNPSSLTSARLTSVGALFIALLATSSTFAASINYGNYSASAVDFRGVTESSGTDAVPLYGAPSVFNNGLNFPRPGFTSLTSGSGSDITDGQLNVTISAKSGSGIGLISISEGGDYSLIGTGTAATTASFGAIIHVTVTEINGLPIAPLVLPPVNATVAFNLLANAGIVQPWSLGLNANIAGQLAPGSVATEVEVSIDNNLTTTAESSSTSLGAKKRFTLSVETITGPQGEPVPETGNTILLLGATLGLLAWARGTTTFSFKA